VPILVLIKLGKGSVVVEFSGNIIRSGEGGDGIDKVIAEVNKWEGSAY